MPNMVIPNEAKLKWLSRMISPAGHEDLILGLYQNNYTPVDGSSFLDFAPSTFAGYNEIAIVAADWSLPVIIANVGYLALPVAPAFTSTDVGGHLAYGWYLREDTSDTIMAAQRFAAARNMINGQTETLNPFRLALKTFI